MIRRRTLLTSALAAGTAIGLSACGDDASSGTATTGAAAIDGVTVSGEVGAEPKVTFPTPLSVTKPESKVVTPGTGAAVAEGDILSLHTAYVGAEDGKVLQSAWQGAPANVLVASADQNGEETATFLTTCGVGARFAMLGQVQDNTGQAVSIVQVSDIVSVALAKAQGAAQQIPADQPQFTLGDDGRPTLSGTPTTPAPAATVATVAIQGDGADTVDGNTLVMHYTGWKLSDGSQFDSSWDRGTPFAFALGAGQVIAGWDGPLAGQKVGSQLLLVIPPVDGYGEKTADNTSELAGETLVFVADILDSVPPAAS